MPVKQAEVEAWVLELKELEKRKRAIIASTKEEEVAALDEKIKAPKRTV